MDGTATVVRAEQHNNDDLVQYLPPRELGGRLLTKVWPHSLYKGSFLTKPRRNIAQYKTELVP
jgi:hypothetical protein